MIVAAAVASQVVFFTGSVTPPALGAIANVGGFGVMYAVLACFCLAGALAARQVGRVLD